MAIAMLVSGGWCTVETVVPDVYLDSPLLWWLSVIDVDSACQLQLMVGNRHH